jgi:hypothetical protein
MSGDKRCREQFGSTPRATFIDTFGPEYVDLALELSVDRDRINTIIAFAAAKEHGVKSEGSQPPPDVRVALAEMAELVANGTITGPIAATYPRRRAGRLHELASGHTHGDRADPVAGVSAVLEGDLPGIERAVLTPDM